MARKGKLFYKIGEVCKICDVPAHVLRYWETEFPLLAPNKNRSGQRIFREKDVQLVAEIKRLLYEEGVPYNPAIPEEVLAAVKQVQDDIAAGRLQIEVTKHDARGGN